MDALASSPEMSEAKCASASPEVRFSIVSKLGFDLDCEACRDSFYEIYAERLQRRLGREFPKSKSTCDALENAMQAVNEFASRNAHGGTGFGHENLQIPARAAWIVYTLNPANPQGVPSLIEMDEIRRFGEIRGRARYKSNPDSSEEEFERSHLPRLVEALADLVIAEHGIDSSTKRCLRDAFVHYLKVSL
jgi:hypothetical protein